MQTTEELVQINNKKNILRDEGIDPEKVQKSGDVLYWLSPGSSIYQPFGIEEFRTLGSGKVML